MKEIAKLSITHDRHDGGDDRPLGHGSREYIGYLWLTGRENAFLDIEEGTAGKGRLRRKQRVENLLSTRIEEDEGRIRQRRERLLRLLPESRQIAIQE